MVELRCKVPGFPAEIQIRIQGAGTGILVTVLSGKFFGINLNAVKKTAISKILSLAGPNATKQADGSIFIKTPGWLST